MLLGSFQSESLLHHLDINFEFSGLLPNNCIDEKVFLLEWANLVDGDVRRIVEVEVANDLGVALLDQHVSHFPQGKWSTVEKLFKSVLFVHKVEFWSGSVS